jgi:MFS family permease
MTDVTTVIRPVAVAPTAGEFRIGRVFSRTLTLLSRNFPIYFVVAAFAALPSLLLENASVDKGTAAVLSLLGLLGMALLYPLAQATILHIAFQDMGDYRVSLSQSIRAALGRWPSLIGLTICAGLAIGVGFLLLIVPGVILMIMWYVVMPACVVERLGVSASMARSSALTKGHRWQIFGMWAILAIASGLIAAVVKGVLGLTASHGLVTAGSLAWSAFAGAFGAIFIVVAYHDLRAAKEGIDIRQLAAVFD